MPKLSTPVSTPEYTFQIHHQHQLLSMGSCFAEHIGAYLAERKFQQELNPFGIVYHPLVAARLLDQALNGLRPKSADLFAGQGLWRHFDFHSRYAHHDQNEAIKLLDRQYDKAAARLRNLDILILTFGTAYGYRLREDGTWVNNCHKQPPSSFEKCVASTEEMTLALSGVLEKLKVINPNLQVILTISPVRHMRDGLLENQRSKARLLLTQEALCTSFDFVHYFPSYEILLDELRDYRFYADDLLHPSPLAIEIISDRFGAAFFSEETKLLCGDLHRLFKASLHRPLHPGSEAAAKFRQQTIENMDALMAKHQWLDFSEERDRLLRSVDPSLPRS